MADPLSVISSVVGVGIAALQSAKLLFELADGIKNAPEEIKAISNDTHAFYDVVFSLETSLKDADVLSVVQENTAMVAMVANLEKPLRNCSTTLGQLMLKIRDRVKPSVDGKSYKFSSSAQWYFTKKDIKEVLDRLEQNKATLNAALNTITAYVHTSLAPLDLHCTLNKTPKILSIPTHGIERPRAR